MTIQQALLSAIKKLQKSSTSSAHLDAEVLLSSLLKKPKAYLLSHQEKKLTGGQARKYQSLIQKRQRGMPVAYLTGRQEFYGLDFLVDKNVLIPRPETETLVEEAIKIARQLQRATSHAPLAICDIGTGSGCIAITLAKYLPRVKIIATDISKKALAIAKKNAQRHKVLKKIKFIKGDLLTSLVSKNNNSKPRTKNLELLVANLPYLNENELDKVRHEPRQALYGGKLGLELLEELITQATRCLVPGGIMLLEISPAQIKAMDYIVERELPTKKVSFIKDLAGRDRVAVIK